MVTLIISNYINEVANSKKLNTNGNGHENYYKLMFTSCQSNLLNIKDITLCQCHLKLPSFEVVIFVAPIQSCLTLFVYIKKYTLINRYLRKIRDFVK